MANWVIYDNFRLNQLGADRLDFRTGGDTLKIMIVTSAYTPAQTTHDYKNDLTGEVSGTNYTARGSALASKTLTLAAGVVTFDAADVTFAQSGTGFSNARYAILYKDTAVDSTSTLIAYADFTTDKGNVAGDLVLQMDAAGIITSP